MKSAARWLDFQHETPSFSMDLFADRVSSILDAPLPRCLRTVADGPGCDRHVIEIDGNVSGTVAGTGGATHLHKGYGGAVSRVTRGSKPVTAVRSRSKPVHELLLEKGRMIKEAREALCEEAIAEEMREVRSKPHVSEAALSIPPRKEAIEDRLLRRAKEAKEQQDFAARARSAEEQKELERIAPFRPTISRRGRMATPRAYSSPHDTLDDWCRRREQRLEAARVEKLMKEISQIQTGPVINSRSERLAARRREQLGLTGLGHIEAMIEQDRFAKMNRWESYEAQASADANPTITLYAATLRRDGSVADRLYAESKEVARRREERARQAALERGVAPFTPRISARAQSAPRFRSVEDDLLQRHLDKLAALEKARKLRDEADMQRNHPVINPVSDAIASALSETSKERLYATRPPSHARHAEPIDAATSSSGDTSDAVGGPRRRLSRGDVPRGSVPIAETLKSYEERRRETLRRLQEEKAMREEEECTFAPRTNRSPWIPAAGDVAERNSQWLARKQLRLEELRQQKAAESEREHSLRTGLESTGLAGVAEPRQVSQSRSLSIYGSDGTAWGVQEYLERQEEARQRKAEKEAKLCGRRSLSASDIWTSRVTKPKEFKLGVRENVTPIRSLQRPPQVPLMSPNAMGLQSPRAVERTGVAYEMDSADRPSLVPPSLYTYE